MCNNNNQNCQNNQSNLESDNDKSSPGRSLSDHQDHPPLPAQFKIGSDHPNDNVHQQQPCQSIQHDDQFSGKSHPKPIELNIPSRTMSGYFRFPPPTPAPNVSGTNQNLLNVSNLNNNQSQHTISRSASVNSFIKFPASSSSTPQSPNTYVPILISSKDFEATFMNKPPPLYGIDQSKLQLGSNPSSPILNRNSFPKSPVKRTKSHHNVFWDSESPPLTPSSKLPVSARLSILGKPLPVSQTKSSLWFHQERVWLYNFLQRPCGFYAYAYHSLVAFAIVLGLTLFAFSTVQHLQWWSIVALRVLDSIILAILSTEFIALFWASSCLAKYQGWKGKFRFLFSPFRLLELTVIGTTALVLWTHWFPAWERYLVFLRCVQILRLENRFKSWRLLGSVLWLQRKYLLISAYMSFLILVVISYIVYFCEQDDPDTVFTNIPSSMYWGVVTVCTIGYGDMWPKTPAGQALTSVLAILGAIVYAIPAGVIATGLALKVQERERQKHINKRRIPAARLIQSAWRCYAASKKSNSMATWTVHQSTGSGNFSSHHQMLSTAQKNAIRFIRSLKYDTARREFQNAFRPYDIKDVMQQYSQGHADVVDRVRCTQAKIHMQSEKIDQLERTVQLLVDRLTLGPNFPPCSTCSNCHHHNDHYEEITSPDRMSFSETSTIFVQSPTFINHHNHIQDTLDHD